MPDVKELAIIVDDTQDNPAIDTVLFPGTKSSVYWSSSTRAGNGGSAWGLFFCRGIVVTNNKADDHYVRCVR